MSTEVGNAVDVVRKQAQALMESVNQLIAVVKEPEIQQALIEVQQGLQKVLDKFDNTGMRDIDSLIEVVSELRDVTDKLTDALQKLQERVNTETGTEGSSAADLADELQLQQSLQVIYSTLEDTIKAMDNVPQLMSTFSGALGSFTQQQLNAYMQFTEPASSSTSTKSSWKRPSRSTRRPAPRRWPRRMCRSSWTSTPCPP